MRELPSMIAHRTVESNFGPLTVEFYHSHNHLWANWRTTGMRGYFDSNHAPSGDLYWSSYDIQFDRGTTLEERRTVAHAIRGVLDAFTADPEVLAEIELDLLFASAIRKHIEALNLVEEAEALVEQARAAGREIEWPPTDEI